MLVNRQMIATVPTTPAIARPRASVHHRTDVKNNTANNVNAIAADTKPTFPMTRNVFIHSLPVANCLNI